MAAGSIPTATSRILARRAMVILTTAGVLGAATAVQPAQDDRRQLEGLLDVVGRYLREYERSFSAVVSRERYIQRARSGGREEIRDLRSETALVAVGDANWFLFRDVHEVNGRVVQDRGDRLTALFLKPNADLLSQAKRVVEESARYNLGASIMRNMNTPTQALVFLRLENQGRSTFRLGRSTRIDGVEARELRFQETTMPRVIITRDNAAARGRAWVSPDTGTVIRTELIITSGRATAMLTVTYARQAKLSLWVPIQMLETYESDESDTRPSEIDGLSGSRIPARSFIEGRATYGDFRRFSVDTKMIIR